MVEAFVTKMLGSLAGSAVKDFWKHIIPRYGDEDMKGLETTMKAIAYQLRVVSDRLDDPGGDNTKWIVDARELICDIEDLTGELERRGDKNHTSDENHPIKVIEKKIKSIRYYYLNEKVIGNAVHAFASAEGMWNILNKDSGGGGWDARQLPLLRSQDVSCLVDIDHPRDKIISWLDIGDAPKEGSDDDNPVINIGVMLVVIVGAGGLGKTTLAGQVFNQIEKKFHCKSRVFVSRKGGEDKILKAVHVDFKISHDLSSDIQPLALVDHIQTHVEGKRFLVVLDDVWDYKPFPFIMTAFGGGKHKGGRIIVTTRNNNVAEELMMSSSNMRARVYQMGALGKDSSRKLLLRKVHSKPQSSPDYIERILAKCDGSPLALTAVSDLIEAQKHIIQWNELYNTMTKFGLDSSNKIQMMRVDISHSYLDLPYHKRDCLLYLSLLPNDEIDRKCLVSRWVAEGLVADETDGKKMFRDLVNRNLILPPVIKYDGDASTYKVHPTIHDFTVWKAVEYNFITLPNATGQSRGKVRRISVHKNTEGAGDINLKEVDTSHLRSFSMSGPGQLPEKMSSSVLRLLVLEKCKNDGTVLWKPFQPNLKHLKLEEGQESYDAPPFVRGFMDLVPNTTGAIGSDTIAGFYNIIKGLARIENAKNLRTMDVRGLGGVKLEEAVTKLERLACLLVHQECTLPNGIAEMKSLEELQTIGVSNHNLEFLRKLGELPKLRTMGIYLTSKTPNDSEDELLRSLEKLVKEKELRSLYVFGGGNDIIPILSPRSWGRIVERLVKFRMRAENGFSVVPLLDNSAENKSRDNSASASGCSSKEGEERVVSHGDVVLIRSDLAILRGPHFIDDRIIAFYFAHLSADLQGDDLLLLPPSITYLLSNPPDRDSVAAVANPLRLASRGLALLPVNDNPDASVAGGGSHWTLLVLDSATSPSAPRFVHHDSLRGAPNLHVAERLSNALRPLLQGQGSDSATVPLVQGPTPTQTNGYDCGVYVMAIARAICTWWNDGGKDHRGRGGDWFQAVSSQVDARSVEAMRTDLLRLINTLIQEKAKSNSTSSAENKSRDNSAGKSKLANDSDVKDKLRDGSDKRNITQRLRLGFPAVLLEEKLTEMARYSGLIRLFLDLDLPDRPNAGTNGTVAFSCPSSFNCLEYLGIRCRSRNLKGKFSLGKPKHLILQIDADMCQMPEYLPDGFSYATATLVKTPTPSQGNASKQVATNWTTLRITTPPDDNREVEVALEIESRCAKLSIKVNNIVCDESQTDMRKEDKGKGLVGSKVNEADADKNHKDRHKDKGKGLAGSEGPRRPVGKQRKKGIVIKERQP